MKFSKLISLPGNRDLEAIQYFSKELLAFKSDLEEYRGMTISKNKVAKSISLYNEIRKVVSRLWKCRDEGTQDLTAGELIRALKGSQVLPPEMALENLKSLLEDGKYSDQANRDIRLMILGNDYADVSLIDVIESAGGYIIIDDTSNIGRFFSMPDTYDDNPIDHLSRYYLFKASGCYRLTYEERWEHILKLIKKWQINACINFTQKYCDTSLFESPLLTESLKQVGIPCLSLEIDDTSIGLDQIKTRVEAFLETIGGI
jgi:benzoyl-CoA reductase/2-hydroxyglutaryl-CoA dehydratase subunit BcrC/BadD/HgdB